MFAPYWLRAFAKVLCICTLCLTTVVDCASLFLGVLVREKRLLHQANPTGIRRCVDVGFLGKHLCAFEPARAVTSADEILRRPANVVPATRDVAGTIPLRRTRNSVCRPWLLYEDDDLLILNKPAGITTEALVSFVHDVQNCGARPLHVDSLSDIEGSYFGRNTERPGLVHRLDAGTSGALVTSKTLESSLSLKEQFRLRQVKKLYIAITHKVIPRATTASWGIRRSRSRGVPMEASENVVTTNAGKLLRKRTCIRGAITLFKPLLYNKQWGAVLAAPITGRTHQIRVHLKTLGTPVLGDVVYGDATANDQLIRFLRRHYKYGSSAEVLGIAGTAASGGSELWNNEYMSSGGEKHVRNVSPVGNIEGHPHQYRHFNLCRPLLHAAKITFQHPSLCRELTVTAPVPKDMSVVLDSIDPSWRCSIASVFANKT